MRSNASSRPPGRSIEERWRDLGIRRRWDLVAGGGWPEGRDEAITMLGYARTMRKRSWLWVVVAGLAAFSVVIALEMLIAGSLDTGSVILAGGIAVGVGIGFQLGGRYQARRMHRKAEATLAATSETS